MVDSSVVEEVSGDDFLDNLLQEFLAEVLSGNFLGVLGRDNNGVDTEGDGGTTVLLVLNGDLSLGVRTEPWESTGAAGNGHSGVELVGEHDSQRHVLLCLVGGITEHDTLVTSTEVLERTVVQPLSNIRRLLLNGHKNVASLVVEALRRVIIANLLDGLTNDFLVVNEGLGRNFSENHDHAGLRGGLASNLGEGILSQASIELQSNSTI